MKMNTNDVLMSWGLAAVAGVVAFVLLMISGTTFIGSVYLSGVLALVLGLAFMWLFCRPMPEMGHVARDIAAAKAARDGSARADS
jgi:hypothetical protein